MVISNQLFNRVLSIWGWNDYFGATVIFDKKICVSRRTPAQLTSEPLLKPIGDMGMGQKSWYADETPNSWHMDVHLINIKYSKLHVIFHGFWMVLIHPQIPGRAGWTKRKTKNT